MLGTPRKASGYAYTVNVTQGGIMNLQSRVASLGQGGYYHVFVRTARARRLLPSRNDQRDSPTLTQGSDTRLQVHNAPEYVHRVRNHSPSLVYPTSYPPPYQWLVRPQPMRGSIGITLGSMDPV